MLQKKLRKYKFGDYINEQSAGLMNLGSSLVDIADTPNKFGARTTGGAMATGALKGAASGAVLGVPGAIIGGAVGAISGLIENNKAKEKEERVKQQQQALQLANIKNQSQAVLSTYPSYGILQAKYGAYLANGGNLPIPVDNSEMEQLSENTAVYNGETHENGGIKIDTDNDSTPEAEIEDGEVINENMVLSNRLKPSTDLLSSLKGIGVNIKSDDTYASLAERFAKKKGDYEQKLGSNIIGESGTAKLMIEKYDNVLNNLFQDQELQKFNKNINSEKMNNGGWLPSTLKGKKGYYIGSDFVPKMPDGGKLNPPKKQKTSLAAFFDDPKTKSFTEDKGWVNREDYEKWKKAYFEEGVPYGTQLEGGANLFWGDGLKDLKEKFDSDKNISKVRIGKLHGDKLNQYLYPKGAPATFEPYRNQDAGIIEYEVTEPELPAANNKPKKAEWVSMDKNTYPTNYSAITMGAGKTQGATKAYGMSYKMGGKLPKYFNGGYEGDLRMNAKDPLTLDYTPLLEPKGRITYPFKRKYNEWRLLDSTTDAITSAYTPSLKPKGEIISKIDIPQIESLSNPNKTEFEIPDMTNALATAGFLGNKSQINKLETEYTPTLSQNPAYNFTNRLPQLNQDIQRMFRTAGQGIRGSSAQDNQALYANMFGKSVGALNRASLEESAREDAFKANYNNLVQRNNMYNTSVINQANYASMDNRNQAVALRQQNMDSAIKSVIGNQFVKDQQDLDFAKNYFELMKAGDTGVDQRMLDKMPEWIKRKILKGTRG